MNIGTIIDAAAADDPGRVALIIDDHIPYNDTGKVNRHQLAALIADGA
jgi:hypothetical protein